MPMRQSGFTLIELLIVIAIIGVLAAIAIPQFKSYRNKSYDSATQTDLRNVATAQEAYYTDNRTYCSSFPNLQSKYNVFLSPGVTVDVEATQAAYTIKASHLTTNKTYTLNGPGGAISGN